MKLIVPEVESRALADFIGPEDDLASCALARVEVLRALRRHGTGPVAEGRTMLEEMTLLRLDDALLSAASEMGDARLRTLDAIHVAAAASLGDELEALVSYDSRMLLAAEALALPVASPA